MTDAVANIPDYPIIVTKDGQNHILRIPELYLVETGVDLAVAHARIEERRRNVLDQYTRLNATAELPAVDGGRVLDAGSSVRIFALKAGIIALAAAIMIATAAFSFSYAVREPLRHNLGQKMGRMIINQIEKGLLDAAKIELTPERTAKLQRLVADWVPYVKPHMAELRPLFAELCLPTPGKQ